MRLHSPAFPLLADFGGRSRERDHDAELKDAFETGYRQGRNEGRSEAEADGELRLAEARERFAENVEQERAAWQRDCSDLLIARLDGAVRLIASKIEDSVASLLRPWLVNQIRERAVEELGKAISRALTEGAKVHIEAPPEILEHLRQRLPGEAFQIGYSESATLDVRADVKNTEIEANIAAWISELEAATQ